MPAKTVRVSEPRSRVSFSSLSAPSTYSALTIRATLRSMRLNSSMEIVGAGPLVADPLAFAPPGTAPPVAVGALAVARGGAVAAFGAATAGFFDPAPASPLAPALPPPPAPAAIRAG